MTQSDLANIALVVLHALKPHLPAGTQIARPVVEVSRASTGDAALVVTMKLKEPA